MSFSSSSSYLKPLGISYAVTVGALVVYNLRWRYVSTLWRRQARKLPVTKVEASSDDTNKNKRPILLLLHGMWHDAAWFYDLQVYLQKQGGYTSWAIDLLPGERFLLGFTQAEIVADLECTLRHHLKGNETIVLVGHSQGGLVAQCCLHKSPFLCEKTRGTVLMGTYPLGHVPPFYRILRQPRNMYNHYGVWGIYLFGRLWNLDYLKHIFFLRSTYTKISMFVPATTKDFR